MKNIIWWIMFAVILFVVIMFIIKLEVVYALLFAICDLLILKRCISKKHEQ